MYDPFGYYKDKNLFSIKKDENLPFYEDFPVSDTQWFIGENWAFVDGKPSDVLVDPLFIEFCKNACSIEGNKPSTENQIEGSQTPAIENKH
jgi:hypothetical protein